MTWGDALTEAVLGGHVSAPHLDGAFVSYAFAGLRITYPSGSSSGFSPLDVDKAAEWSIVWPEAEKPKRDKWGRVI